MTIRGHNLNLILFFFLFAASSPNLKVFDIQVIEIIIIIFFYFLFINYIFRKDKYIIINSRIASLTNKYIFFFSILLALSLINLSQDFFVPIEIKSLLKQPFYISILRFFQLLLAIITYIFLSNWLSKDYIRIIKITEIYSFTGTIICIYSIISYVVLFFGIADLGGAYETTSLNIRARGMFNEGGPFGTYVVTVMLFTILKQKITKTPKITWWIQIGIQLTSLLLSQSKSAFIIILITYSLAKLSVKINIRKMLLYFTTAAIIIFITLYQYQNQFIGYLNSYYLLSNITISETSNKSDDNNLVMGRIAGAHIVPNMIINNPLTGVGIGNYSIVRNDPKYLDNLPEVQGWDLHGLGLLGSASELGIPLLLYFCYLLLIPKTIAKNKDIKNSILVSFLYLPFIIFLLGTQFTFLYPWIVLSVGLGIVISKPNYINSLFQEKKL